MIFGTIARVAFRKVADLGEDKNRIILDKFERRLTDLIMDTRSAVRTSDNNLETVKKSGLQVKLDDARKRNEILKAQLKVLDDLQRDLEAITIKTYMGAP